jgi:DNA-binding response OmpR family regulator
MSKLAVLTFKDNEKIDKYIKKLNDNKHNFIFLDNNLDNTVMEQTLQKFQGVIFFENELSDLNKICESILKMKKVSTCYIWVISTTPKEIGKMVYLQLGADAVFENETSLDEIELIINNALSRNAAVQGVSDNLENTPKNADFQMFHGNLSVLLEGDKEVPLTRLEFKILDLLYKKPKVAFTYQEIYQEIYQEDMGDKHYRIANIIFHLRKKIEVESERPKYIKTVRSKGYMLDV